MTHKQFEAIRRDIQQQRLAVGTETHPIAYASQRIRFKIARLEELMSEARKVNGSKTVQAKLVRWERQLVRLQERLRYFAGLQSPSSLNARSSPKRSSRF